MSFRDVLWFAAAALRGHRLRTGLMLLAMAIGVASVVVLTALGEGARNYVEGRFTSLGTHLLIVLPGRSETKGGPPPLLGETPRDLTLDDALALHRSPAVDKVAPLVLGNAPVAWKQRDRDALVLGSTADLLPVRHLTLAQGQFLPETDPRRSPPVCVLGAKLRHELFGPNPALGEWVRLGEYRFRVIGVLAEQGRSIGVDLDEVVIIPVASAQRVFDAPSLFRILVSASSREMLARTKQDILDIIRSRHEGEDDITVITQDAVLATFDRILQALTLVVAGIAAISLIVAGILIMNVMLVAVTQRTTEIGLLKALGASSHTVLTLFLTEAGLLSLFGACLGLAVGQGTSWLFRQLVPEFPVQAPLWAIASALGIALVTSILFALLPARRAAQLDPVQALSQH